MRFVAGRSSGAMDRPDYRRTVGLWGTIVFASLSVVGMFVQVYLIAGVLFGENWLQLHRELGKLVHLGYLLTFGAALVAAAPHWRWLLWPSVLAVLGSAQAFLAGEYDIPLLGWRMDIAGNSAALHAFHGALVPIVFAVALRIVRETWTALHDGGDVVAHREAGAPNRRIRVRPAPAPSTSLTTASASDWERRRWLVVLLVPLLAAFAFLCATFAIAGGPDWAYLLFAPTVLLGPTWAVALAYLATTSEADAAGEHVATFPPPANQEAGREAA